MLTVPYHTKPQNWNKSLSNWVLFSVITGQRIWDVHALRASGLSAGAFPHTANYKPQPQTKKFIVICKIKRKDKKKDVATITGDLCENSGWCEDVNYTSRKKRERNPGSRANTSEEQGYL